MKCKQRPSHAVNALASQLHDSNIFVEMMCFNMEVAVSRTALMKKFKKKTHTSVIRNPPIISERAKPNGKFLFSVWKKIWARPKPPQINISVIVCVRIMGNILMSMYKTSPNKGWTESSGSKPCCLQLGGLQGPQSLHSLHQKYRRLMHPRGWPVSLNQLRW